MFEPPEGGVPEHVLSLALGLREHGFDIELAGPPDSQIHERARAAGIVVHPVSLRRDYSHPWDEARAAVALRRLIRSRRPAIVHCHASKAGAVGRVAAVRLPAATVYTPHCFGFVGNVGRAREMLVPAIERGLSRVSGQIICVSREELDLAQRRRIAAPDRLTLVYNGVPAPDRALRPDPRLAALREDGPLLANIAALRSQKRQDVFLDAAAIVLARHPSARLALVGNGPLEPQLRAQAERLGLAAEPRFAFIPFEPPAGRYLRLLDGFVLSSDWEALPISLLEALAWRVPQIATAVAGVPEVVTPETGRLVAAGDPGGLAAAMLELLDERTDRQAMSAASGLRYEERFTVERMVAQTAAVYRGVLPSTPLSG